MLICDDWLYNSNTFLRSYLLEIRANFVELLLLLCIQSQKFLLDLLQLFWCVKFFVFEFRMLNYASQHVQIFFWIVRFHKLCNKRLVLRGV